MTNSVPELYVRAAELLNSERGAVRFAGLVALAELGQEHPDQRQPVVDVICAYLRTPAKDLERGEERQVHLKAHRLLAKHLTPDDEATFWPDMELNLIGATLLNFRLNGCHVRFANFVQARFIGMVVDLGDAVFTKGVWLGETLILPSGEDGEPEPPNVVPPPGWHVRFNRSTGRGWFMPDWATS